MSADVPLYTSYIFTMADYIGFFIILIIFSFYNSSVDFTRHS